MSKPPEIEYPNRLTSKSRPSSTWWDKKDLHLRLCFSVLLFFCILFHMYLSRFRLNSRTRSSVDENLSVSIERCANSNICKVMFVFLLNICSFKLECVSTVCSSFTHVFIYLHIHPGPGLQHCWLLSRTWSHTSHWGGWAEPGRPSDRRGSDTHKQLHQSLLYGQKS